MGWISKKGFIFEAYELYDEGIADFEDIDLAIKKGLNHPLGPFELSDYSSLLYNFIL